MSLYKLEAYLFKSLKDKKLVDDVINTIKEERLKLICRACLRLKIILDQIYIFDQV